MKKLLVYSAIVATATGLAAAASAQPNSVPGDFFPTAVYVTLQASNAVEDLASGKTYAVPGAHFMTASHDGTRLLVGSATTPDVYLLDAHSGQTLATFKIGPSPQGTAISPDGHWGLAASAGNGTVSVIDLHTLKLVKSIAVGKNPWGIQFAPDGKQAYGALEQHGSGVAVINMQTFELTGQIPVPGLEAPHTLAVSADGRTLWVRGLAGHVAAVDIPLRKELAMIPVGASHAEIDVVPGGHYVVTGGIGGKDVDIIDVRTFKVVKSINVGAGPHGVCASRDGHWIYAGVISDGTVAVIDTRTLKIVKRIPTRGQMPVWLVAAGRD